MDVSTYLYNYPLTEAAKDGVICLLPNDVIVTENPNEDVILF